MARRLATSANMQKASNHVVFAARRSSPLENPPQRPRIGAGLHRTTRQRQLKPPTLPTFGRVRQSVVAARPAEGGTASPVVPKKSAWDRFKTAVKNLFPRPDSLYSQMIATTGYYNEIIARQDADRAGPDVLKERAQNRRVMLRAVRQHADRKNAGADVHRVKDLVNEILKQEAQLKDLEINLLSDAQAAGIVEINLSLTDLVYLKGAGFCDADILTGMQLGLNLRDFQLIVAQYNKEGIPFNERTYPGAYSDDMVVAGSETLLGSGQMNSVQLLKYQLPDGQVIDMVFKPAATDAYPDEAWATGIPQKAPDFAGRNAATYAAAKVLGPDASMPMPETEITVHNGKVGTLMRYVPGDIPRVNSASMKVDPTLASWLADHPPALTNYAVSQGYGGATVKDQTVQFVAHARPVGRWDSAISKEVDFAQPEVRRDLTTMQWMDLLMGQADRNRGNYVVQHGPDGRATGVCAIDNDLCAGRNALVRTDEEIQATGGFYRGGVPSLPKVIDSKLKKAFLSCTLQQLRDALSPYLAPEDVDARVAALARIKSFLGPNSEAPVREIDTLDEWSSERTANDLGMLTLTTVGSSNQIEDTTRASYVARDHLYQQSQQHALTFLKNEVVLVEQLKQGALTEQQQNSLRDELKATQANLKGDVVAPLFDPQRLAQGLADLRNGAVPH